MQNPGGDQQCDDEIKTATNNRSREKPELHEFLRLTSLAHPLDTARPIVVGSFVP
jgi:hypothetical protein